MGSLLPTVCALAWQLTHTIRRLSSSKALGLLLLHRCSHNFVGTNQGYGEAHNGHCSTLPMLATLSTIDDLAPIEPDCFGAASDDGTGDDAGHLPLGW